jgi:NAD(P)-dependent dehydrogenase (short-subunit alcohol dehydrogenase family)
VTGAGRGIGAASAQALVSEGWFVVVVESDPRLAAAAKDKLADAGTVVFGDISDPDTITRTVDAAAAVGSMRAWINNAAAQLPGSLHDVRQHDVQTVFDVNIRGYFNGSAAAIRAFLVHGLPSAIVNISSVHGQAGFVGWAAYDTSKGAVDALTRHTAVAYGPLGIRANAVSPGAIQTEAHAALIAAHGESSAERLRELTPLKRLGTVDDVAHLVAFLAGQKASYITGQIIAVDGGWSAGCLASFGDPAGAQRT